MNRRLILGAGLLLAASFSGWLAWQQRPEQHTTASSEASTDFRLGDFQIVALNEDGSEAGTLRAPSMQRNRADQVSTIEHPVFLLPDAAGQHWQLQADTGLVSAKGDTLKLRGNVAGDSPRDGKTPPTTFRTTKLDVLPKRNLAQTTARVSLARPGLRQTGVGFRANLKTRQYSLLSQVKTRYEPDVARQAR